MDSLKKNRAFKAVYGRGVKHSNRLLAVYAFPNQMEGNRLGVSVSRKVGKAVVRNRIKRLVKENVRLFESQVVKGYDIVVVARVGAGKLEQKEAFYSIGRTLRHLFSKQQLFLTNTGEPIG